MQAADKRLTPRDMIRFARLNKILNLCKNPKKAKTYTEITALMDGSSYETTIADVKILVNMNYLASTDFITEKFKHNSKKFHSLRDRFLMADLVPASVAQQKSRLLRKQRSDENPTEENQIKEPLPCSRTFLLMDDKAHFAKMNQSREKKKSDKVYVSGSTFSIL